MKWPCTLAGCEQDEDCADAVGGACGYYGEDEPGPVGEVSPEPWPDHPDEFGDADAEEWPDHPDEFDHVDGPEPWDPQPIRAEEIPVEVPEEYRPVPLTAEEQARRDEHLATARRVHVAPLPSMFVRLGGEFDPRGRHVGCDGEPGPAGGMTGGCGAGPGIACRPPRGRFVPGFVHPSRIAAERMMYGLDPA